MDKMTDSRSAEAQAQGGGEVLGYVRRAAIRALRCDGGVIGVMVHSDPPTDSVPVYLAPPSAPVGVDGLVEKWRDDADRDGVGDLVDRGHSNGLHAAADELESALAQQPAAKPYTCDFCGSDYTTRACCDARYDYLRALDCKIDPPMEQPEAVDGAMVERMAQAVATELYGEPPPPGSNSLTRAMMLPGIKRALTAALAAQPGGSDNG